MKELTYKDWMMKTNLKKEKLKVIYFKKSDAVFKVIAMTDDERMTNYELAKWLYDGASCGEFREYKCKDIVCHDYMYHIVDENEPCSDNILIRSNGGEWREPLKESEE